MNFWTGAAAVLLIVWAILVFAVAPPSGWVHLPLAAGMVLLARGLMGTKSEK